MNCYQKFYTNQIHSSSLLCQLATMWKSQVLCDAIIRSGSVITKAHRVVLVAACPMLQSMENAAVGSHLEVRLASDIKQESVQMFLQYLYEGFMMLTEQNCRDVEKIARLLQVDSIIKCCADFNKCLASKTGNMSATDQYKYTFHDMVEFKHVRSSDLQKTMQDRMVKRGSEFSHPSSPSTKRSRTQEVMDDTVTGCYGNVAPDPWDRVPRLGMPSHSRGGSTCTSHPGVVDIVGDGIELIQTDPPDSNAGNRHSDRRISQKTVSIAVASQINSTTDLQVVDVAEKSKTESRSGNTSTMTSHGRVNTADPSPSSVPETSKSSNSYNSSSSFSKQISPSFPSVSTDKFHMGSPPVLSPTHAQISSRSSPQFASTSSKSDAGPKPFAAGSESQSTVQQQSSYSGEYSEKNSSEPSPDTGPKEISDTSQQRPSRTASASSKQEADIAIVKIESEDEDDTGGLEMYVNMPDGGEIRVQRTEHDEEGDPQAEWGREENEDSNVSGDQNNSWLFAQSQFKVNSKESNAGESQSKSATEEQCAPPKIDPKLSKRSKEKAERRKTLQALFPQDSYSVVEKYFTSMHPVHQTMLSLSNAAINPSGSDARSFTSHIKSEWPYMGNENESEMQSPEQIALNLVMTEHKNSLPQIGQMATKMDKFGEHMHALVPIPEGKYKTCSYCQKVKHKTKSGWYCYTTYQCRKCDVPLCKRNKNCFMFYHRDMGFPEHEYIPFA